ncbi:MAG: hypothetical protein LBV39_05135 [Bacteroidales bacterium]|nr:hypothetical protein [Bacteroidales bacterium]
MLLLVAFVEEVDALSEVEVLLLLVAGAASRFSVLLLDDLAGVVAAGAASRVSVLDDLAGVVAGASRVSVLDDLAGVVVAGVAERVSVLDDLVGVVAGVAERAGCVVVEERDGDDVALVRELLLVLLLRLVEVLLAEVLVVLAFLTCNSCVFLTFVFLLANDCCGRLVE